MNSLSLPGFLRVYALPALWLFALPLFGLWFTGHAAQRYDTQVLEALERNAMEDERLGTAQRDDVLEFFRSATASTACMSTGEEFASYREMLGEACSDAQQFGWMHRLCLASVVLGLLTGLIGLICALAAFVSRPFQYGGFVVGWNVLRVTSALQVVAQGGLAVWLSFWMTALWLERYSVKLILIVGAVAAMALWQVVKAIFRRPDMDFEVEAEVLEEAKAPELWAHVRGLCERLGAPVPANILAGIDTNFFVTESPVRVGERLLTGCTLFVSLSFLRLLERSEADAVLAHEMAHLLGGDTGHVKRLAPMLKRFDQYLEALEESVLTRPIFLFMRAYRDGFELSLGRSHRASELAADRLAAGITSGKAIARSLVKTGAYARFRGQVELRLFEQGSRVESVALAQRVALGFAEYASSEAVHEQLHGAVTPHPFDSHPPLQARLENVGEALEPADVVRILLEPTGSSWVSAILEAEAIEARLWGAYEARFQQAHDVSLAYRYVPSTDEERRHVEKHFPPVAFEGKEPGYEVRLDYAQVSCTEWEEPLPLEQVASAATDERLFKKYLDLTLKGGGVFKGKRSVCLSKVADADGLLNAFGHYLGRHRTMEAHQASLKETGQEAA